MSPLTTLVEAVEQAKHYDKYHQNHAGYELFVREFSRIYDAALSGDELVRSLLVSRGLDKPVSVVDLIAISSSAKSVSFIDFKLCISKGASIRKLTNQVKSSYELLQNSQLVKFSPNAYDIIVVIERNRDIVRKVLDRLADLYGAYLRRSHNIRPVLDLDIPLEWSSRDVQLGIVVVRDLGSGRRVGRFMIRLKNILMAVQLVLV